MTKSDLPPFPAPSTVNGWHTARRLLIAAAAAATLLAIFYTVENWRGQRAWGNCRRALEAKGEVLDWAAYVPAPVPDDQNFYKAPHMQEWFVKGPRPALGAQPRNGSMPFQTPERNDTDLVLAEVKVVAANARVDSQQADAVLRLDDMSARDQAAKLLRDALGPCSMGARNCVLVAQPLEQVKVVHLVLQEDAAPTPADLTAFFPRSPVTAGPEAHPETSYLQVEGTGNNVFRLSLKQPVYSAADYLASTEILTAEFDQVRKALERPYARIDCDYGQPYAIGIPNFITLRTAVQILSERTQSHLLLGQPEAAWHELALIHDLCQILMAKPAGKPILLVGAMIHVAVDGLYANVVQDGLRLHAWREPQLLAIERQLRQSDRLPGIVEALREERAATSYTFETVKRSELVKLFSFDNSLTKFALAWMPRGWFYQNMAVGAMVEQDLLSGVEPTNQLIRPHQTDQDYRGLETILQHPSPYTFLVAVGTPNFLRAVQTVARNQTLVNQAWLACALERYRLAEGQYPEKVDALTPGFVEKLPHDLIGGQPLKYHRTEAGGYLLYSIGWDEKDDGGVPGKNREEGDWVWELR